MHSFSSISVFCAASWLAFQPAMAQTSSGKNCSTPTQFFTQLVEHNSSDNSTFQQQYQVISKNFKAGGPILYYQQAETAEFACLEDTILPEWAAELGALAITIEHRFFGLSNASNASDPKVQYKSLTLENVMSDAVDFIGHVQATVPGAGQSKVIATGGSYGGFLTTVLKMNYPEVFYGAIPYGAPLRAIGANYQNPRRYNWFNWANQIYWDQGAEFASKVKNAFEVLNTTFYTTTNASAAAEQLSLCTVPQTPSDFSLVKALVSTSAFNIPQLAYNNPVANPYDNATMDSLVAQTLNATDPLDIVRIILTMRTFPSLQPCVTWDNTGKSAEATLDKQPFNYLLCKYFPLSSNEVDPATIFPPTSVQTESDPTTCGELFDIVPPTQEEVLATYKLTRGQILDAPRILFAYQQNDPTTGVGLDPWLPPADRNASRYMITSMAAHGEESLASAAGDKPTVVNARQIQLQTIKEWLGIFN